MFLFLLLLFLCSFCCYCVFLCCCSCCGCFYCSCSCAFLVFLLVFVFFCVAMLLLLWLLVVGWLLFVCCWLLVIGCGCCCAFCSKKLEGLTLPTNINAWNSFWGSFWGPASGSKFCKEQESGNRDILKSFGHVSGIEKPWTTYKTHGLVASGFCFEGECVGSSNAFWPPSLPNGTNGNIGIEED